MITKEDAWDIVSECAGDCDDDFVGHLATVIKYIMIEQKEKKNEKENNRV